MLKIAAYALPLDVKRFPVGAYPKHLQIHFRIFNTLYSKCRWVNLLRALLDVFAPPSPPLARYPDYVSGYGLWRVATDFLIDYYNSI